MSQQTSSIPRIRDALSGEIYTFDDAGRIPFVLAATVVCLRRQARPAVSLKDSDLATNARGERGSLSLAMHDGELVFSSGFQVLVGQSHVVNYLKSNSLDMAEVAFMRYPGEWLLPGGSLDPADGEDLLRTAIRELQEEFLLEVPRDAEVRPFSARQTRMIRGRSNMMVNMVAVRQEKKNDWLDVDLGPINAELRSRQEKVEGLMESGEWRKMSREERQALSPEMVCLEWRNIEDLVLAMQRCISVKPVLHVNDWQRAQFEHFGLGSRSPVNATMNALVAVEARVEELDHGGGTEHSTPIAEMIEEQSVRFSSVVHKLGTPLPAAADAAKSKL